MIQTGKPYRVLVVDDSALMRSELSKIIELDPQLEVVGTAINGHFAIEKVQSLDPDVVTLDVNMPQVSGLEALKTIMRDFPRPVVMISSLTQEGAEETIEALELGAVDFLAKPSGSISRDIDTQGDEIRKKIRTAATARSKRRFQHRAASPIKTTTRPAARTAAPAAPRPGLRSNEVVNPKVDPQGQIRGGGPQGVVVGIGVSTGGPKTLMNILPQIPGTFPGSIVIAQHMPEKFTSSFAQRLDKLCPMSVKEAQEGDIIESGTIYIAPGGKHLTLVHRNRKLLVVTLSEEEPGKIYKPSVDILFESLNLNLGKNWLGVMLTGMGADGAKALTALRKIGGHTICESEESCVVFGMPGRVVEMGGAEFILDENQISEKIIQLSGDLL